jgi:hypothetical protein
VRCLTTCIHTQNNARLQNLRDRDITVKVYVKDSTVKMYVRDSTVKMYVFLKVQLFLFYKKITNITEDPEEPEISKSKVLGFGIQTCTLSRSYSMRRNDLY